MILVLNILDRNNGSYLIFKKGKIIFSYNFILEIGEESILKELDIFLKKNKILLNNIKGLILLIKESSLTQVKVIFIIINTLGWNLNIPVVCKFYFFKDFKELLPNLINKIENNKSFKYLDIKYKQKPNITLSKNKNKYIIK
tara:strand:- start:121 stop:546 length:426 start_codon:yes stop_codon:yes gene_type:complete